MTYREVIKKLNLQPLPGEGGYYRQTWQSESGTAIYFLLTPEKNGFSALHKLSEVEIYHFYAGDPVQLVLFPTGESTREIQKILLGSRIEKGESPQFPVPADTIQGSCLLDGGQWALLGTTMAPPYSQDSFQLSRRSNLLKDYPEYQDWIMRLTREEATV
ncbi:MAG: cupin domain-containing protein [Spirochaetaceae bacterium]|nr:cupin domain-containing protein [Spirochaetaceae bacterium]